MNRNSHFYIFALSEQFKKYAKLDPFRNIEHDIEEAIDFISSEGRFSLRNGSSFDEIPLEWFEIQKIENFPIQNLYQYDDIKRWLDVDPGELKLKSKEYVIQFLKTLRGTHTKLWIKDGIPAIVLADICGYRFLADGRGRTNFAIGMNLRTVPVVLLTLKSEFENEIEIDEQN